MNDTANFDEFLDAFDGAADYQTDSKAEAAESTEETQENVQSDAEDGEQGTQEAAETEEDEESGEKAAESGQGDEMFTLKVNKEERTVNREEVVRLAQMGADYERVKGQAERAKSDNKALQEKLDGMQPVYDVIAQIAKDTGVEVPQLLDTFRIRQLMDKESLTEKEATERLGRLKAEAKLSALQKPAETKTVEQQQQERAERELKEFRQNFPDVDIASLPVEEMAVDIATGMTMTQAYLKSQNRKQQEEIQRLNQQLKAKEQNDRNRVSSPGSASDSGARKSKDQFDDFFTAFG